MRKCLKKVTGRTVPATLSSMVLLKVLLMTRRQKKDFSTLIEIIKVPVTAKRIARIGMRGADKKRPIKVSLTRGQEKNLVLRNLSALNPIQHIDIKAPKAHEGAERAHSR